MTFGGIGLILIATITPTTYLGSWAFVVLIIDVRFMVEHIFLLKTLAQIGNNTSFSNKISRRHVIYHP
jgi:hypothetical protein